MFAHIYGYAKKVDCAFKINCMIYKLYLNKAVKKRKNEFVSCRSLLKAILQKQQQQWKGI